MVRIINQESSTAGQAQLAPELTENSKVLLRVIGILIADRPDALRELLADYSVTFREEPTGKELVDTLLSAIGECDPDFNRDLASIILDCTLENAYDSFDIKSLFSKNKEGNAGADSGSSSGGGNTGGGGLWTGIANAVGSVGGAIGQGLKGKQAREQATANTLQGMYAYKNQLAANEQSKGKNNLYILLAVLAVVGLAVTALVYFSRKQEANTPELQPMPLNT